MHDLHTVPRTIIRELKIETLGSLSSDVFERRTSSGSEPFPLLISLDATVFILPSVLILRETICPKICSKSRLKSAKRPFPVDVRRSKTSLLKLPIKARFKRQISQMTNLMTMHVHEMLCSHSKALGSLHIFNKF